MTESTAAPGLKPLAVAAAVALGIIGAMTIWIVPGFLALVADQAHLNDRQLGYIAAWDINASAAMIAISIGLLKHCNWRVLAGMSLVLIAAGNCSTAAVHAFNAMVAARIVAGAGEGLAIGVAFAALGQARNPDRAFAIYLGTGGAICALILLALPRLQSSVGTAAVFVGIAGLALLTGMGLRWFPERSRTSEHSAARALNTRLAVSGLLAVFLYFLAQGAIWSYFERIGEASQLRTTEISSALALATIAGIGGALTAALLPARLGRAWPIAISACLSVASFLLLLGHVNSWVLTSVGVLSTFAWNFSQPLFSGLCCEADPHGRVVCAMGSVQTVGYGLGPAVAALLLVDRNFVPIVWMSTSVLVAGVMAALIGMRGHTSASALAVT